MTRNQLRNLSLQTIFFIVVDLEFFIRLFMYRLLINPGFNYPYMKQELGFAYSFTPDKRQSFGKEWNVYQLPQNIPYSLTIIYL